MQSQIPYCPQISRVEYTYVNDAAVGVVATHVSAPPSVITCRVESSHVGVSRTPADTVGSMCRIDDHASVVPEGTHCYFVASALGALLTILYRLLARAEALLHLRLA